MRIEWSDFFHKAGWLGVLSAILMAGPSALAQEIREEFADVLLAADEGEAGEAVGEFELEVPEGEQELFTFLAEGEGEQFASPYWIGVICNPADESLRAQLKLDKKGLVIVEVMPDSPASSAGLAPHDVLIKAGELTLTEGGDLVKAVEEVKEGELKIMLLRGGDPLDVVVKPASRPGEQKKFFEWSTPYGDEVRKKIEMAFEAAPGRRARMRFIHPGMLLPHALSGDLPDGMSVSITKSGSEPAKIVVKRSDESWEVTEDTLDKLPEDVRKVIVPFSARARAMRIAPPQVAVRKVEAPQAPFPPGVARSRIPPRGPEMEKLSQQVAELNEQIAELRKAIEALKKE